MQAATIWKLDCLRAQGCFEQTWTYNGDVTLGSLKFACIQLLANPVNETAVTGGSLRMTALGTIAATTQQGTATGSSPEAQSANYLCHTS